MLQKQGWQDRGQQERKQQGWMVRASRQGRLFEAFVAQRQVAIGWSKLGDLRAYPTRDALREAYLAIYGNDKPAKTANAVAMVYKFAHQIEAGHLLLSYCPKRRIYLVAEDLGRYHFKENGIDGYGQLRDMRLLGMVARDQLSRTAQASLGSTLSLFSIKTETLTELGVLLPRQGQMDFGDDVWLTP